MTVFVIFTRPSANHHSYVQTNSELKGIWQYIFLLFHCKELLKLFKKLINNSRGKYKRNECLINVCKSDTDLS
jgi:hypothetical protein